MTPKDKMFRFRLTEDELQKIEEDAKKAGFLNLSEYVRYMTIGEGSKIKDIDENVKLILKKLDKK